MPRPPPNLTVKTALKYIAMKARTLFTLLAAGVLIIPGVSIAQGTIFIQPSINELLHPQLPAAPLSRSPHESVVALLSMSATEPMNISTIL